MRTDFSYTPDPERAIYLHGDIEPELVSRLTPQILSLQNQSRLPITVYIDSPGGNVESTRDLLELLRVSNQNYEEPCEIITVATVHAYSAAADILTSGSYAIAYPNTKILHHGSRIFEREWTYEKTAERAKDLRKSQDNYAATILRKSYHRLFNRFYELYISSEQFECLRHTHNLNGDMASVNAEWYLGMIWEKLSGGARDVVVGAKNLLDKYRTLQDIAAKPSRYRISAKIEAERIKAMIDYAVAKHKRDKFWCFLNGGLEELTDDFYLLNYFMSVSTDESWKEYLNNAVEAAMTAEVEQGNQFAQIPYEKKRKMCELLLNSTIKAIWPLFASISRVLQQGENWLTAADAYWLGLIDEVWGVKELSGCVNLDE